jgi:hypothetical protein
MRATSATLCIAIALAGTAVHAQPTTGPAAVPAAPTTESAASAAPVAQPAAASATTPAAAPNSADAANDKARQAEWARIAQQRAEVQLMLARARAANEKAQPVEEREPDAEPAQHGDAGAPFALGISFEAPWYTDPGYDVFAKDDVAARFGLWASYDVAAVRDDAFVAVELGWGTESEEDHVLSVADTKLATQVAYVGATLRWVPISWLQPHLRLAGGVGIVDAQLDAGGTTYHDGAGGVFEDMLSPFGSAGLGFTLRTATRTFEDHHGRLASLSFGLMFEGGYTLAKPIDIALDGPGPSARDIALSEPKLGELKRSGPYFRVSLVGRI